LLSLSRGSESRPESHILGYADSDAEALIGTAEGIIDRFAALEAAGAAYVLLSGQGSRPSLRRFADKVMPKFGTP
jgi:alkanesulfonate monooxygenase SsuD/methylene tetrahydromethanopterin reductase-like flavin-dependent oxidoreductase (luciferase family)